jgi:hypothetical protein
MEFFAEIVAGNLVEYCEQSSVLTEMVETAASYA